SFPHNPLRFPFFFNAPSTPDFSTLSLHDALPISPWRISFSSSASLYLPSSSVIFGAYIGPFSGLPPTFPPSRFARWQSVQPTMRSEEHTSELQSRSDLVCRLLLEKKKKKKKQKSK